MTERDARLPPIALPPLLRSFSVVVLVLTVFSALYSLIMIKVLHAPYPYNLPYFNVLSEQLFHWDFNVFTERYKHFGEPAFWDNDQYPFTYPAFTGVIFAGLYKLPHAAWLYLAMIVAAVLAGAARLIRELTIRGISRLSAIAFTSTLLVTSWPLLFLLQRANIEGIVVLLTATAILATLGNRWWLAATLIGAAGAMKIFPLVLLGLLLSHRRYKQFFWGLAVAVLLSLGSLALLGPSIREAQQHIAAGLAFFEHAWAGKTNAHEFLYDHSLFPLLKLPVIFFFRPHAAEAILSELRIYTAVSAVAGVALFFLVIRRLPLLNQVFALVLCAIILPPVSFDYTLPHLFVPFALLCLLAVDRWRQRLDPSRPLQLCFALFAVIFTDLQYINVAGLRLSGQVRCVALIALLITVLRSPFPHGKGDPESCSTCVAAAQGSQYAGLSVLNQPSSPISAIEPEPS